MYNRVIMVGNLTRDIELRYTPSGTAIAKTGIATNRRFKTQTGEQKEETCFIDITIFGRAAEVANQYLSKGRQSKGGWSTRPGPTSTATSAPSTPSPWTTSRCWAAGKIAAPPTLRARTQLPSRRHPSSRRASRPPNRRRALHQSRISPRSTSTTTIYHFKG